MSDLEVCCVKVIDSEGETFTSSRFPMSGKCCGRTGPSFAITQCGALEVRAPNYDTVRAFAPGRWVHAWIEITTTEEVAA